MTKIKVNRAVIDILFILTLKPVLFTHSSRTLQ